MRNVKLAACVLLSLALGVSGLYASGFENTGLGTTARGMGGAFRAIADDWTAAYYNPAGYAFIPDNLFGANLAFFQNRHEITPRYAAKDGYVNGGEPNTYGWGIVNNQPVYNFNRTLNNPSAGMVMRLPVWGETVFGLSVYQPFDQSITWRMYDPAASNFTSYNTSARSAIPGDHYKTDLDVVSFQLSAGREFIEDKLSLGLGIEVLRTDLWYKDLTFRQNPREGQITDRPRDRIPEFTDNDGRGWSLGFRAGMMWKLTEKLNLAVTGHLPFSSTVKGTTVFRYILPEANELRDLANLDRTDYLFIDGQAIELESDFETEVKLPPSMALGLAFDVTEKLTLALDAEYTFWSQYDGLEFTYTGFSGLPYYIDTTGTKIMMEESFFTANLSEPVDWDNAGKVALGARYHYNPTLTLLGGLSIDQSPSRTSGDITPQFLDTGDKYGFNVGGILHINQWDIGLITSYTYYPEDLVIPNLEDIDDDGIYDNFPGSYDANFYETVLSVGYRF